MPYATQADLVPSVLSSKTCMELTDDTRSGVINADTVTKKLVEASGLIEMYCRERYKLPLQPTEELVALTTTIAAYKLYSLKPTTIPESIKDNYQDALRQLRDIAANKASLDQPIGTEDQVAAGGVVKSRKRQVFGERNLEGFN